MGLPPPPAPWTAALIVFVLTPEGDIATIGGESLTAGQRLRLTARGPSLGAAIRQHMASVLPHGTLTSRLRPLMPRLHPDGHLVMPLWATGRHPDAVAWRSSRTAPTPPGPDALGDLARSLGDDTLVAEAWAEFRRALAADPASHQLMTAGARLRVLALDELNADELFDEWPPIFGLLPERFTIQALQDAVRNAARFEADDVQRSSNFRRRLEEFQQAGVIERAEQVREVQEGVRGRRPQLYRFNPRHWRQWLMERSAASAVDDLRTTARRRALPDQQRLQYAMNLPVASYSDRSIAASETTRLERLEDMVQLLQRELAALRPGGARGRRGEGEE